MSTVADMWSVQVTDLAVESLRRHLAEVERQLQEPEPLLTARQAAVAAEQELAQWQSRRRSLDTEAHDLAGRIAAAERDLMSGRVRNPKELASMEANVAALRRHRSAVDEQLLEAMLEIERCQGVAESSQSHLTQLEREWQAQQAALLQDREHSKAELQRLGAQLQHLWSALSPQDRELYRGLRSRKGGRAVVSLQQDICQGCGMSLPTGIVQRVRASQQDDERVFCPACGRLLVSPG